MVSWTTRLASSTLCPISSRRSRTSSRWGERSSSPKPSFRTKKIWREKLILSKRISTIPEMRWGLINCSIHFCFLINSIVFGKLTMKIWKRIYFSLYLGFWRQRKFGKGSTDVAAPSRINDVTERLVDVANQRSFQQKNWWQKIDQGCHTSHRNSKRIDNRQTNDCWRYSWVSS